MCLDRLSVGCPRALRGRLTETGTETCESTKVGPAGTGSFTAGQAMRGLHMREVLNAMTMDIQAMEVSEWNRMSITGQVF